MKNQAVIPPEVHFCASCKKRIITGAMPKMHFKLEQLENPTNSPDCQYTLGIIPLFEGPLYFCDLKCLKYAVNYER